MKNPGRKDEINMEPGCIDLGCEDAFPHALWLTLLAMLANLPAMVRYIRTGEEPK